MRAARPLLDKPFLLLTLVALLLGAVQVAVDLSQSTDHSPKVGLAEEPGPWTLGAAFTSLQRQGVPVEVRVQDTPFLKEVSGTLVLATPTLLPLRDDQVQDILDFVERGNRLVFFSWCGVLRIQTLFGLYREAPLTEALGVSCEADVFDRDWLEPKRLADKEALWRKAKEGKRAFVDGVPRESLIAVWKGEPPLWLESRGQTRFTTERDAYLPLLVAVDHQAVGLYAKLGEGEVLVLPLEPFANHYLDDHDHLELLFRLVPDPQSRPVLFWEYLHHPHAGTRLADLWLEHRLWLSSLLFGLWLLLWLYAKSRPFGNPISAEQLLPRESEEEHLHALAGQMERFRLDREAVGFLLFRLRQGLARQGLLTPSAPPEALVELARQGGMDSQDRSRLSRLLAALEHHERLPEKDLRILARLLDQVERSWPIEKS